MAGHFIYKSDLTGLDDYMKVLQRLPDFTRSFKVNLDLIPPREYGSYRIPEIEKQLSKASNNQSIWSKFLVAIKALHTELEMFTTDIIQSSEGFKNSNDVTQAFIAYGKNRLGMFVEALEKQLETLQFLTEEIRTILPRIQDFLNSNIYRHAHQYGLITKSSPQSKAMDYLTSSISYAENGPALSPQARLNGARSYVKITQRQYAEAYCAATNMNAYLSRICTMLDEAFGYTMRMHKTPPSSRPYVEARLMLVSLKEIHRLATWFNTLAGSPVIHA